VKSDYFHYRHHARLKHSVLHWWKLARFTLLAPRIWMHWHLARLSCSGIWPSVKLGLLWTFSSYVIIIFLFFSLLLIHRLHRKF